MAITTYHCRFCGAEGSADCGCFENWLYEEGESMTDATIARFVWNRAKDAHGVCRCEANGCTRSFPMCTYNIDNVVAMRSGASSPEHYMLLCRSCRRVALQVKQKVLYARRYNDV